MKDFYTIRDVAKLLGISRIAVFKKVKAGKIKAIKIGRFYAIPKSEFSVLLGETLTPDQKRTIRAGVKKTIKEYRQTLELLGKE